MCSKGIVESFGNLEYVKPPNEGIASFALRVFSTMGRYYKVNTFNAMLHTWGASIKQEGLDKTI